LVYCVETGEGKKLAEELVKRLTGGDELKGRFMRQDFFSFKPTHKLWLSANHKPIIRGTDHAIWRRIPLIPFTQTFVDPAQAKEGEPIKDADLPMKLARELPGILAKAVRAAKDWYDNGLPWPEIVRAAVAQYREEQDTLGLFLEERVVIEEGGSETATDIYHEYKAWAEEAGEWVMSQKKLGLALVDRGFVRAKASTIRYNGLRLLTDAERAVRGLMFQGAPNGEDDFRGVR
jgi:putative DNA primase/helicase